MNSAVFISEETNCLKAKAKNTQVPTIGSRRIYWYACKNRPLYSEKCPWQIFGSFSKIRWIFSGLFVRLFRKGSWGRHERSFFTLRLIDPVDI